jgi:hypothetical protein
LDKIRKNELKLCQQIKGVLIYDKNFTKYGVMCHGKAAGSSHWLRAKSSPRPHVFSPQQQASDDTYEPLLPKDGEDLGLRQHAVDRRSVPSQQQLSNLIEQ